MFKSGETIKARRLIWCNPWDFCQELGVHSKLRSIIPEATKVHVVLLRFVALTQMWETMNLVQHVTLSNNTKEMWAQFEFALPSNVQDWSLQCPSNTTWPFKIYLLQQPFKTQLQVENEGVTWSPHYNMSTTRTNMHRHYKKWSYMVDS